jgi:hypothetical protein
MANPYAGTSSTNAHFSMKQLYFECTTQHNSSFYWCLGLATGVDIGTSRYNQTNQQEQLSPWREHSAAPTDKTSVHWQCKYQKWWTHFESNIQRWTDREEQPKHSTLLNLIWELWCEINCVFILEVTHSRRLTKLSSNKNNTLVESQETDKELDEKNSGRFPLKKA